MRRYIVYAADFVVIVAQLGQPRLHGRDEHALVMQADGDAGEGGKRLDGNLRAGGILGLTMENQRLQIRVRNAVHGQAVHLLQGDNRLRGGGIVSAVGRAGQVAQFRQRLLERQHLIACRAVLQHFVGAVF